MRFPKGCDQIIELIFLLKETIGDTILCWLFICLLLCLSIIMYSCIILINERGGEGESHLVYHHQHKMPYRHYPS